MSVINQMLKDLENRQPQHSNANSATYITTNKSPVNLILLVIVILFIVNIAGYFIWSLYSENQSLKQRQQLTTNTQGESHTPIAKHTTDRANELSLKQNVSGAVEKLSNNNSVLPVNVNNVNNVNNAVKSTTDEMLNKKTTEAKQQPASTLLNTQVNSIETDNFEVNNFKEDNAKAKKIDQPKPKSAQQLNPQGYAANSSEQLKNQKLIDNDKAQKSTVHNKPASLVISRKKMTVDELVAQKLAKAQRAINGQKIIEAESLFEEVLLLKPSHHYARKQLAALWYGRKSYQAAINLLQQGIANVNDNADYRLMQARIYNELGRYQQAFDTLSVLPNEANNDYQAMLASTAQQLGNHPEAISAYGYLTKNEPTNARWWLGLAISYDSTSQFAKAIQSYKLAMTKQGLSANTRAFAQQRLVELGE